MFSGRPNNCHRAKKKLFNLIFEVGMWYILKGICSLQVQMAIQINSELKYPNILYTEIRI